MEVQVLDLVEHGSKVGADLLVGDAEDAIAELAQVSVPISIVGDLGLLFVNRAVQLQDQPQFMTEKIGDVGSDWNLTTEFQTADLPAPKLLPKCHLHRCGKCP